MDRGAEMNVALEGTQAVTEGLDQALREIGRTDLMVILGDTRADLVKQLRRSGDQSVVVLAETLRLKRSTVRCNLESLLADGLVSRKADGISGPGRPKYLYRLTPTAEALFPTLYSFLSKQLLRLATSDKVYSREEIVNLLAEPWRSITPPRLGDGDIAGRVDEAVNRLNEVGVLADAITSPDDSYVVSVYHCPLVDVIGESSVVCHAVLMGMAEAFADVDMHRVEQTGEDGLCGGQCAYFIRRVEAKAAPGEMSA
ncbi:MAG TPA: hypothetical protein VIK11_11320 [Tepidiformaceae bacterium]